MRLWNAPVTPGESGRAARLKYFIPIRVSRALNRKLSSSTWKTVESRNMIVSRCSYNTNWHFSIFTPNCDCKVTNKHPECVSDQIRSVFVSSRLTAAHILIEGGGSRGVTVPLYCCAVSDGEREGVLCSDPGFMSQNQCDSCKFVMFHWHLTGNTHMWLLWRFFPTVCNLTSESKHLWTLQVSGPWTRISNRHLFSAWCTWQGGGS